MTEKLTWQQYIEKFPQPFDLGIPGGEVWCSADYDEKRKANMRWQAEFYTKGFAAAAPSVHELATNPFIAGGIYWGRNGPEAIDPPNGVPQNPDWGALAAAGEPVIGGTQVVPATQGPGQ